MTQKQGKLLIISGPSGVGKTTICELLCENNPKLQWSISVTTRPKRTGEVDGQDYYFISEGQFLKKIEANEFLEYAKVHNYYYGTPKRHLEDLMQKGFCPLLEIDVQGARSVKQQNLYETLLIFILPPDIETLRQRLSTRNLDSQETIERRIQNANKELKDANFYDYYVVNKSLQFSVNEIETLLKKAGLI